MQNTPKEFGALGVHKLLKRPSRSSIPFDSNNMN